MDLDFGSSGVMALPDQVVGPPHLLFIGSKLGTLYLLDADNLGQFHVGDDSQIVQSIAGESIGGFRRPPISTAWSMLTASLTSSEPSA